MSVWSFVDQVKTEYVSVNGFDSEVSGGLVPCLALMAIGNQVYKVVLDNLLLRSLLLSDFLKQDGIGFFVKFDKLPNCCKLLFFDCNAGASALLSFHSGFWRFFYCVVVQKDFAKSDINLLNFG